jgi:hypothetical protein
MRHRTLHEAGRRLVLTVGILAGVVYPAEAAITIKITITPTSISFPDANPTTTPSIPANTTVDLLVQVGGGAAGDPWSVHALAPDDLISGNQRIAISNVTWTATAVAGSCSNWCNCLAGAMSKSVGQNLIQGQGNTSGCGRTCRYSFSLANSWLYEEGSYSQVVTITATSP